MASDDNWDKSCLVKVILTSLFLKGKDKGKKEEQDIWNMG